GAFKDTIDVRRRPPKLIRRVYPVRQQAATLWEVRIRVDCRQAVLSRQRHNQFAMRCGEDVGKCNQSAAARFAREYIEGALDLGGVVNRAGDRLYRERRGGGLDRTQEWRVGRRLRVKDE